MDFPQYGPSRSGAFGRTSKEILEGAPDIDPRRQPLDAAHDIRTNRGENVSAPGQYNHHPVRRIGKEATSRIVSEATHPDAGLPAGEPRLDIATPLRAADTLHLDNPTVTPETAYPRRNF